jgi:hypothetical protein
MLRHNYSTGDNTAIGQSILLQVMHLEIFSLERFSLVLMIYTLSQAFLTNALQVLSSRAGLKLVT